MLTNFTILRNLKNMTILTKFGQNVSYANDLNIKGLVTHVDLPNLTIVVNLANLTNLARFRQIHQAA